MRFSLIDVSQISRQSIWGRCADKLIKRPRGARAQRQRPAEIYLPPDASSVP